jgi:ATP-dependent exoDNAse (exonuclease V) beta subunit
MLYDMFTGQNTDAQKTALSIGEDPAKISTQIKEAQDIIANFQKSAAFKELQQMEFLAAELPFTLRGKDGTVINGIMDAVFKTKDGGIFIADYKSDNIKEEDLAEKTEFYKQQLLFYKDAAKEIFKQDKAEAAVIYLRPAVSEKV